MPFDPDAFLADKSGPLAASPSAFDPDAFLANQPEQPKTFDPDAFLADKVESPDRLEIGQPMILTGGESSTTSRNDVTSVSGAMPRPEGDQHQSELRNPSDSKILDMNPEVIQTRKMGELKADHPVKAAAKEIGMEMAPTVAALAAASETAAVAGRFGGLPAFVGGLAVAMIAGGLTRKAQDFGLEALLGADKMEEVNRQLEVNRKAYPKLTLGAQMAPQAIFLKPSSLSQIKTAFEAATKLGTAEGKAMLETEAGRKAIGEAINLAVGSGTGAALEAWNQIQSGQFDAPRMVLTTILGGVLSNPTKAGKAIGLGHETQASRTKEASPKSPAPNKTPAKPFEYGPDIQAEGGKSALAASQEASKTIKEDYPLDTHENVTAAITDLNLGPELAALHDDLDKIRLELKFGERVAGRIPKKNERGEIIDWMDTGAAYPGGLGADTIPAIRNYLDGKPLTENQQRQLTAAVKHTISELSGQAGFDIANQTPVNHEDMRVGDQVSLAGEKFTVKDVDPQTGDMTLKDGKLVTLKAGETLLADRNSHLDAEGKPPIQRETAPFDPDAFLLDQEGQRAPHEPLASTEEDVSFDPDSFLADTTPEPIIHDLGDGISAEHTPEGHWELIDANGTRTRLDPTVAADHALIQQIEPDARAAEVKRIATETADKLPGARIHFIDDETSMGEIRAKYGDAVKDIKAEDGTIRGFAVVGTNDYFILPRNMSPSQAARTVIHEAAGHIGIRGVLGDRFDTVMDGIFSSRQEHQATLKRLADRYGLDLTTVEGRREATEELLAHVAERRQKDPGAWKRLVAKMKDYFRKMGFDFAQEWTDNDILTLIERGKERVSRPEPAKSSNKSEIRLRKNPLKASDETDTVSRMSEAGADAQNKGLPQSKPGKSGNQYEKYAHQPNPRGAIASDISSKQQIPKDVYDHPEWYGETESAAGKESWETIKRIRGNPDAEVTIYRAVPKGTQTEIHEGQWVSLSKSYAEDHASYRDGIVLSLKVKAKDIRWDGNDFNEFGYFPKSFDSSRSENGAQTIRQAKQSGSGLTQADRDMLLKSAKQRLYGRPDLSQVTTSKQTRALVAEVDQSRNEKGQPTPQTFKTWKESADTRIQKDTTGEWLQFLAGKIHYEGDDAGQNTMVARKLLESKGLEAFASGDDAEIAKVGAAIWGYRNTRSNLARALAAGRDFLETPAERNRRWIAEALYYPGAKVDRKLQGMDLKSMQAELQKRAGKMQEIRTKLLDMGIDLGKLDEKTLNDPHAMAEIVRQIQISNAGYGDMAYEYWRNGILSALPTHAANTIGNMLNIGWQYTAQKWTEAIINGILGRTDGTTFKELPGTYKSFFSSISKAARNSITSFSTEQGVIEGIRLDDKGVAIPGKLGRIIRIPQRSLLAADEFAKTALLQSELYSRAYQEAYTKGWRGEGLERRIKEILADPKSDMINSSIDEIKRLSFQTEPGELGAAIMKLKNAKSGFIKWPARFLAPFVGTPSNILKTGIKKTPLGMLHMPLEAIRGTYSSNKQQLIRDSSEQILALAGTLALISLVNDENEDGLPRITGSGPSGGKDAGKQQAEQRMYPAQSIRIGGRWYSYSRIEPLATAITHTIDVIEAIKNKPGEDFSDQMGRIVSSMKSLGRDKTFMAMIGDMIRATEDDSKGLSFVQNFLSSWIPNIIRSGARATDPYYRSSKIMPRDDKNTAQELAANIGQAAMPMASIQDAPRMDFWGRPLQKTEGFGPATDILYRLVSPMTVQHAHAPDNFDRMLFNYNRKATAKGWEAYWPAMPGNAFELPGARGIERTARMNPDEYSRFLKRRGDFFFEMAAGTQWPFDNPKIEDIALFKKIMSRATTMAKQDIYQERTMNPALKSLKLAKEAKQQRPQVKPLPPSRPMMNLDEGRRGL